MLSASPLESDAEASYSWDYADELWDGIRADKAVSYTHLHRSDAHRRARQYDEPAHFFHWSSLSFAKIGLDVYKRQPQDWATAIST